MPLFLAAIFLSAFLLFQVQPVIARYILPWYGGSPGVWTTCLLFFQVGLLAGYAYAHGLVTFFREKRRLQVAIHLTLLVLAFFLLPITPDPAWKPEGNESNPVGGIIRLLALTVGFPYLLLSASGPLLQHWFAEAHPGSSPYRLYAVSNLGSLLGLLTYPFVIEPLLDVGEQTRLWSWGFAGYGLLAIASGLLYFRKTRGLGAEGMRSESGRPTRPVEVILWIAFSACGSMLLLSLTSQMCQDVAVVPFLWVVPLSLYLLTFIIAFDHERWYHRAIAIPLAATGIGMTIWLMNRQYAPTEWPLLWQIVIYCGTIFSCCLVCHGEVVRMKPRVRHLTAFYLCISLGGAIGGIFVSLAAPRLFTGYWELHLTFVILAILTSYQLWRHFAPQRRFAILIPGSLAWLAAIATMNYFLQRHIDESRTQAIAVKRGFYGVLKVEEFAPGTDDAHRSLHHGRISHGRQYLSPDYVDLATTYYSLESGVGAVFACLPQRNKLPVAPIHVGVVGLGVGTIATYAETGDRFRFYEINPQVEELARSHFSYLADCKGEETVVLGDARVTLEREIAEGEPQQFDALFVDAFSGDSIPVHLLTKEAFELYFRHLKPDGVLAIHITNLHLDLADPVRNLAKELGYGAYRSDHSPADTDFESYYSDWVLITKNEAFLSALKNAGRVTAWEREETEPILWTDDYSNLFDVAF
jgi:spermidine synthase